MTIAMVQGRPDDLQTVIRLRREVTKWLVRQGSDQWATDWPDTETMLSGFAHDLAAGETWFAVSDGAVLGAITINDRTLPDLWTPEETTEALFVHRLTVDRRVAGQGIGAQLLDFAAELGDRVGRKWLRLDAWTTNDQLHRYYRNQGFRHVRTVASHFSPSAACFERRMPCHPLPMPTMRCPTQAAVRQ